MSATRTMAEHLVGLTYDQLPAEVINKCKELILDALACGLGGSRTPLGRVVSDFARDLGGQAHSSVLGAGFKTACPAAAFANASSINALDYDDTGKGGHPGSSIIPAAAALGQRLGADGRSILLACVAGYEIGTRVAAAIEPTWERYQQIHGVGTAQTFGSTAACAKLLDLDVDQTLNAFGVAGASAPVAHAGKFGWRDKSIAFVKDNVAWPAEAGLRAALLAQKGYEGSESILDGETGYWVMAGSDQCNFELLADFSAFEILDVSLKPYPCCRWIHTALDVLVELVKEHQLAASDIERIEVYSIEPLAEFFGKTEPRTFIDVEFSIPCAVALKLFGVPHAQWFEPQNWKRPQVLDLAKKVSVILDEDYQDLYLKLNRHSARMPVRMEISLKGGRKLVGYADEASGSPLKPMSRAERIEKVTDLLAKSVVPQNQEAFIERVERLEEVADVNQVLELLDVSQTEPAGSGQRPVRPAERG